MQIAVSVIVPAYNAEKTLERALSSILAQTLKQIEVIVVDDGSRDATREIARKFSAQDSRVRVIEKDVNEGLSAARNSGIAAATGEYIGFVDSDDWIEPDMMSKMYEGSGGADITVCGIYHDSFGESGTLAVSTRDQTGTDCIVRERSEVIRWAARLDRARLFAYTCNKLYRRERIEKSGIFFEQQTLIEDYLFNCRIWQQLQSLALIDGCYYHYIKFSQEALTQKFLPNYFEIITQRYLLMRDLFVEEGLFDGEYRGIICSMHIKHVLAGMVKNCGEKSGYTPRQQKEKIREILHDPSCCEAKKYAVASRKQERICNLIFKSGSVLLNFSFARLLFKMQTSRGRLFDKLK